jgi:hypothetical protein
VGPTLRVVKYELIIVNVILMSFGVTVKCVQSVGMFDSWV